MLYMLFTYTKADTADADGKYVIDSIDSRNLSMAYLYIATPGYGVKTIKIPNTIVDTGTIDISLTDVVISKDLINRTEQISMKSGNIILTGFNTGGIVRLYDMKGVKMFEAKITEAVTYYPKIKLPGGSYIFAVDRKKTGNLFKQIIIP